MTENQKLREVFEARMTDNGKWPRAVEQGRNGCYLLAQTENAWAEWQACAEALALPTAEQVDDINVAESFTSVTKTAATVGERDLFEREMSKPPFEFCMDRWPDDGSYAWPGNYTAYHTQCAWAAWQARAALSAGDAVDARRYRWLREQHWSNSDICCVDEPKQNVRLGGTCPSGDLLDSAIDAAMRKGQP